MLKTKIFITVFLALLLKIGDAQTWIYVTNTTDDAKIYFCINPEYTPTTLKVWIKKTEGKVTYDKNGIQVIPVGATISYVEFDCLNQKFRIHSVGNLDSDGNVIDNMELGGYKNPWFSVIPDSVYEKVIRRACESSK